MSGKNRRSWRKSVPYRLVAVEWEDSQRPLASWQWVDELPAPEAVMCLSVGFLISETSAAVSIAPNLGDIAQERAQAAGIINIPSSSIRKIADL